MTYHHNLVALQGNNFITPSFRLDDFNIVYRQQKINQILFSDWFRIYLFNLVRTDTSLVATVGFEPTTCRVWTGCSSQLSYVAINLNNTYYNRYFLFCQVLFKFFCFLFWGVSLLCILHFKDCPLCAFSLSSITTTWIRTTFTSYWISIYSCNYFTITVNNC